MKRETYMRRYNRKHREQKRLWARRKRKDDKRRHWITHLVFTWGDLYRKVGLA